MYKTCGLRIRSSQLKRYETMKGTEADEWRNIDHMEARTVEAQERQIPYISTPLS